MKIPLLLTMNVIIIGIVAMFGFLIFHLGTYDAYATCVMVNGAQECSGYRIDLLVAKPSYIPNETVQIAGFYHPNTIIHVDLVDPNNKIINSTLLQSDYLGNFQKKFVVPSDAVNGTWQINATSGLVHSTRYITVISKNLQDSQINPNHSNPTNFSQYHMAPLKQFKSGIAANDITCKEGLQLVIKTKDGAPACVKPDDAYVLIYRGWAKEFIQSNTSNNQSMCQGTEVPSGDYRKNIFPVLIMSPNSTATVCVTYNFISSWQSYPNKEIYPHGIFETCCFIHMWSYSSPISSNKFEILANPALFNVTGVYNSSKISVIYKIHAKSDSKGFYDTSVPFDRCLSYPLAVGYDASEIDATEFHADFAIPCFNTIEDVYSVKVVSGMTYKEVQFP